MLIRFQGKVPNPRAPSPLGIFQLSFKLRDDPATPDFVRIEIERHLDWLKMHLRSPSVLSDDDNRRAIAWFRSDAKRPLEHIWSLKALLEENGYPIDVLKTHDPGSVIYEDGWQVIAKPRR